MRIQILEAMNASCARAYRCLGITNHLDMLGFLEGLVSYYLT